MKNVTITLDDETAARARVQAAERGLSMSRYIGEVLRERMRGSRDYEEAMRRYFANRYVIRRKRGERYPTREEIHDRAGLRRR